MNGNGRKYCNKYSLCSLSPIIIKEFQSVQIVHNIPKQWQNYITIYNSKNNLSNISKQLQFSNYEQVINDIFLSNKIP